jgi:5-methylcytosine-specific restriction endonuclease McrA
MAKLNLTPDEWRARMARNPRATAPVGLPVVPGFYVCWGCLQPYGPFLEGLQVAKRRPRFCSQRCRGAFFDRHLAAHGLTPACPFCRHARPGEHYGSSSGAWPNICPGILAERDGGWLCQLCQEPIDLQLLPGDPGFVTIDHVIPRALGGTNDRTNLRLAHNGCNTYRDILDDESGFEVLGLEDDDSAEEE